MTARLILCAGQQNLVAVCDGGIHVFGLNGLDESFHFSKKTKNCSVAVSSGAYNNYLALPCSNTTGLIQLWNLSARVSPISLVAMIVNQVC